MIIFFKKSPQVNTEKVLDLNAENKTSAMICLSYIDAFRQRQKL